MNKEEIIDEVFEYGELYSLLQGVVQHLDLERLKIILAIHIAKNGFLSWVNHPEYIYAEAIGDDKFIVTYRNNEYQLTILPDLSGEWLKVK